MIASNIEDVSSITSYICGKYKSHERDFCTSSFGVFNPRTGELQSLVCNCDQVDICQAIECAKAKFKPWSETPLEERSRVVSNLAALIEENAQEIAAVSSLDTGRLKEECLEKSILRAVEILRFYTTANIGQSSVIASTYHSSNSLIQKLREPVGLVVVLLSFLYPIVALARALGPALICGNTLVVKVSESAPLSVLRVARLFNDAGIPAGVVQIIAGGAETGNFILRRLTIGLLYNTLIK